MWTLLIDFFLENLHVTSHIQGAHHMRYHLEESMQSAEVKGRRLSSSLLLFTMWGNWHQLSTAMCFRTPSVPEGELMASCSRRAGSHFHCHLLLTACCSNSTHSDLWPPETRKTLRPGSGTDSALACHVEETVSNCFLLSNVDKDDFTAQHVNFGFSDFFKV